MRLFTNIHEEFMRLAFCLFKYYPYGGLERDFLRIAKACVARGHTIDVYTLQWEGERPENFVVKYISVSALTNAGRAKQFAQKLSEILLKEKYDVVIGFNRLPHLDLYFAADPCYCAQSFKKHGRGYRLLPRYRIYKALEESVFSEKAKTKILLLNPAHQKEFMDYYKTPAPRFKNLLPGISEDRRRPENQVVLRAALRAQAGIADQEKILLMVGSDFERKGVDRALQAFAALPSVVQDNTWLWIVGKDKTSKMPQLSKTLGIQDRVIFFGPREDIMHFFAAADGLLHLAYQETAGMVLIEAIVAGLPVIVTANCGYASYIQAAQAGILVPEPYQQITLNQLVLAFLSDEDALSHYRSQALQYAQDHDLFHLDEQIIEIIEHVHKTK